MGQKPERDAGFYKQRRSKFEASFASEKWNKSKGMRQKVKKEGAKLKTVFVPNSIRWTPELDNPIFEAEILEAIFVISPNILKILISCN